MEPRVLILGGGFAGLETAFTLRQRLRGKVRIGLVSGQRDFVFKPNTIYLPFGAAESKLRIGLERPLDRRDIDFHRAVVRDVDTTNRVVQTSDDQRLGYDFLVVATGAAMRPEEVPGLSDNAQMIWTPRQMRALGDRLAELRDAARAGEHRDVLFVVPPNNKCSGPLYEMVFMLETWLRRNRIRDRVTITWATYEDGYIQAFGPRLHQVVSEEFAARGIDGHTAMSVREVLPDQAIFHNGEKRRFDLLVAFPPYVAAVDYPGLPADRRGFLRTELTTRQVFGHPEIYAPGDAGDFPVKQAFLAFLQADAVADDIAAHVNPRLIARARHFDPVSMCVMEMFDKATFAQVPLTATGDPDHPVRVRDNAESDYRVGVSPLWRLGKSSLGIYLPWRFRAGRPFHGGQGWRAMSIALAGMSRVLASAAPRRNDTVDEHKGERR